MKDKDLPIIRLSIAGIRIQLEVTVCIYKGGGRFKDLKIHQYCAI